MQIGDQADQYEGGLQRTGIHQPAALDLEGLYYLIGYTMNASRAEYLGASPID